MLFKEMTQSDWLSQWPASKIFQQTETKYADRKDSGETGNTLAETSVQM